MLSLYQHNVFSQFSNERITWGLIQWIINKKLSTDLKGIVLNFMSKKYNSLMCNGCTFIIHYSLFVGQVLLYFYTFVQCCGDKQTNQKHYKRTVHTVESTVGGKILYSKIWYQSSSIWYKHEILGEKKQKNSERINTMFIRSDRFLLDSLKLKLKFAWFIPRIVAKISPRTS